MRQQPDTRLYVPCDLDPQRRRILAARLSMYASRPSTAAQSRAVETPTVTASTGITRASLSASRRPKAASVAPTTAPAPKIRNAIRLPESPGLKSDTV